VDPFVLSKLDFVRKDVPALELAWKRESRSFRTDIIGPFQYLKGRELALKARVMGPMAPLFGHANQPELLCLENQIGTVERKAGRPDRSGRKPLKDMTLFEMGLEKVVLVMREGRILKDLL